MTWLKQELRRKLRAKRRQLSLSFQHDCAQKMAQKISYLPYFDRAQHIALYCANQGEVSTFPILQQAFALNKTCYWPVLVMQRLKFIKITKKSILTQNRFGILEPHYRPEQAISAKALDLVFFPLVGFDTQGHRLGMGGGYYDKTFAFRGTLPKPRLIGLAYDFQRVSHIPFSNLDVSLDTVITEKSIYHIRK